MRMLQTSEVNFVDKGFDMDILLLDSNNEATIGTISSRKLALASWSCSCFSKLSDGVDAPQKPQIID